MGKGRHGCSRRNIDARAGAERARVASTQLGCRGGGVCGILASSCSWATSRLRMLSKLG